MSKKSWKQRRREVEECAYCGTVGPIEREHVIARCTWLNTPTSPVILPSCDACHKSKSDGESNIREFLTLDVDGSQAQGALGTPLKKVMSSIAQGKSQLKDTLRDVRWERQLTRGGIDLGIYPTVDNDPERMLTTLGWVIRGLYFHETGTRLSMDDEPAILQVRPYDLPGIKDFINNVPHIGPNSIGGGNCSWQVVLPDPSDPTDDESIWLLCYWERVYFLGITGRAAKQRHQVDSDHPLGAKKTLAVVTRSGRL